MFTPPSRDVEAGRDAACLAIANSLRGELSWLGWDPGRDEELESGIGVLLHLEHPTRHRSPGAFWNFVSLSAPPTGSCLFRASCEHVDMKREENEDRFRLARLLRRSITTVQEVVNSALDAEIGEKAFCNGAKAR